MVKTEEADEGVRTAGAREHAIRYLEHFVTYQPGEWGRPQREKAEACLSTLLAALAQAERERELIVEWYDGYRAGDGRVTIGELVDIAAGIWSECRAAAPPPEEEASRE